LGFGNIILLVFAFSLVSTGLFSFLPDAFAAGAIFDKKEYGMQEMANIVLHDPSKNINPGVMDVFPLKVTSDTNPEGHVIFVVEAEKDIGFFKGSIEFTKDESNSRKLHVSIGDRIYIDYGNFPAVAKITGDPIDCGPAMLTLDNLNCISKISIGFDPAVDLEVKTFQKSYNKGDSLHIYGYAIHDPNGTKKISIKIIDPTLKTVLINNVSPNLANQFKLYVDTADEIWDTMGDYTVEVEYGSDKTSTGFELRRFVVSEESRDKILIMPGTNEPGCEIFGECFLPYRLEVEVGQNVTWMNSDPKYEHVIVSGNKITGPNGIFASKSLSMGETFIFQFEDPGAYIYYDSIHPWMVGLIQVKEKHLLSDSIAPMILLPQNMTVNAETKLGATVNFTAKAIDDVDGILEPSCSHESGQFFPIGTTVVRCTVNDDEANLAVRSFSINVVGSEAIFPGWIKEIAALWCNDEIGDYSFIEAIQYLIDHEVIVVEDPDESVEHAEDIPDWIKESACWWSKGEISNDDFANGLKFLISNGIIII